MPAVKPLMLASLSALILLGWIYRPPPSVAAMFKGDRPAAQTNCPEVRFAPLPDRRTELLFVQWDVPAKHWVYAFATPHRVKTASPIPAWQRVVEDQDSAAAHYFINLANGWLYVVATPTTVPELTVNPITLRLQVPVHDSKSAGWSDEPLGVVLESSQLDGLPQNAKVCAIPF